MTAPGVHPGKSVQISLYVGRCHVTISLKSKHSREGAEVLTTEEANETHKSQKTLKLTGLTSLFPKGLEQQAAAGEGRLSNGAASKLCSRDVLFGSPHPSPIVGWDFSDEATFASLMFL